jgi:hypothetical protein
VLNDSGLALVEAGDAEPEALGDLLRPIAAARNARLGWVGDAPNRFIAIRKPAGSGGRPAAAAAANDPATSPS